MDISRSRRRCRRQRLPVVGRRKELLLGSVLGLKLALLVPLNESCPYRVETLLSVVLPQQRGGGRRQLPMK